MKRYLPYIIIAAGAALRLLGLGWDSLWYDEAFTAWLARLPLADMLAAIRGDVHPPLWYLIEWAMVRLAGSSETALRLPACILGIVALPLAWAVAQRLAPRPVALVALAIFALSPTQIYFSQEARMYSLLQVAVLLAIWAALARRWALLAVAGLGGMLTHNMMAVYLVPIFALAFWLDWDVRRLVDRQYLYREPIKAGIAVGLCYAPWAVAGLLPQLRNVGASFWVQPVTWGGFFYPIYMLTFHIAAPAALQLHAGVLMMAAVLWGSVKAGHSWRGRTTMLLAWGPLLILALASILWRPVYLHRTLIGAALPLYILAAWGIVALARVIRWSLVAPLGAVLLLATGNYYLDSAARRWDVRPVAAAIECEPGDVIYHVNLASYILYQYYRPDCDQWVWPVANDLSQSLTSPTKAAMGMQQAALDDIPWRRAWLVWAESPVMAAGEPGAVGAILMRHNYTLVTQIEPGALVTLRAWEVTR